MLFWKVSRFLTNYATLYPRRQNYSGLPTLWSDTAILKTSELSTCYRIFYALMHTVWILMMSGALFLWNCFSLLLVSGSDRTREQAQAWLLICSVCLLRKWQAGRTSQVLDLIRWYACVGSLLWFRAILIKNREAGTGSGRDWVCLYGCAVMAASNSVFLS
jgi:hypothetical protein